MNPLVTFVKKVPLIEQIAIGLVIGIMLAVFSPSSVSSAIYLSVPLKAWLQSLSLFSL